MKIEKQVCGASIAFNAKVFICQSEPNHLYDEFTVHVDGNAAWEVLNEPVPAVGTSTEDVLSDPPASNSSGVSVSTSTEEP